MKNKRAACKLGRLTQDESLALSLGYRNVQWPGDKRTQSDLLRFPRGVWRHPKTGALHTPRVIALMQQPLDPAGKPLVPSDDFAEWARAERLAKRKSRKL